jgi:hypothetical protein
MSLVRKVSFAWLIVLGGYGVAMGIWSTTLKYLGLSNHNVQKQWDVLERFAPSNGVAYALIAGTAAAILVLSWTKMRPNAAPANLTR